MQLTDLNSLFSVKHGNKFDKNKMVFDKNADINFVARTSRNNGCIGTVRKYHDVEPYKEGLITVSLGGSILSCFVQPKKFYTAQNVAVLTPLKEMSIAQKLYYCKCISMNRFKYSSFGREANKTLKFLKVPAEVPQWVDAYIEKTLSFTKKSSENIVSLRDRKWASFEYWRLFTVKKGKRVIVKKIKAAKGKHNFVSAVKFNNGVFCKTNLEPNQSGNVITVNYDGNGGVAEAFYQDEPFWALDSVNVLYPKFRLNPFVGMFLVTLIRKERYRFNYGRKWNKQRMKRSTIFLPIDSKGEPDWKFMEDYVKSLPYSKALEKVHVAT